MIEEFYIGETVVITSTNLDDHPDFQETSKIGKIEFIDKSYAFPYLIVLQGSGFKVWSTVRALTLLERELEDV